MRRKVGRVCLLIYQKDTTRHRLIVHETRKYLLHVTVLDNRVVGAPPPWPTSPSPPCHRVVAVAVLLLSSSRLETRDWTLESLRLVLSAVSHRPPRLVVLQRRLPPSSRWRGPLVNADDDSVVESEPVVVITLVLLLTPVCPKMVSNQSKSSDMHYHKRHGRRDPTLVALSHCGGGDRNTLSPPISDCAWLTKCLPREMNRIIHI